MLCFYCTNIAPTNNQPVFAICSHFQKCKRCKHHHFSSMSFIIVISFISVNIFHLNEAMSDHTILTTNKGGREVERQETHQYKHYYIFVVIRNCFVCERMMSNFIFIFRCDVMWCDVMYKSTNIICVYQPKKKPSLCISFCIYCVSVNVSEKKTSIFTSRRIASINQSAFQLPLNKNVREGEREREETKISKGSMAPATNCRLIWLSIHGHTSKWMI